MNHYTARKLCADQVKRNKATEEERKSNWKVREVEIIFVFIDKLTDKLYLLSSKFHSLQFPFL